MATYAACEAVVGPRDFARVINNIFLSLNFIGQIKKKRNDVTEIVSELETISYPESSGFLVSGVEDSGYEIELEIADVTFRRYDRKYVCCSQARFQLASNVINSTKKSPAKHCTKRKQRLLTCNSRVISRWFSSCLVKRRLLNAYRRRNSTTLIPSLVKIITEDTITTQFHWWTEERSCELVVDEKKKKWGKCEVGNARCEIKNARCEIEKCEMRDKNARCEIKKYEMRDISHLAFFISPLTFTLKFFFFIYN